MHQTPCFSQQGSAFGRHVWYMTHSMSQLQQFSRHTAVMQEKSLDTCVSQNPRFHAHETYQMFWWERWCVYMKCIFAPQSIFLLFARKMVEGAWLQAHTSMGADDEIGKHGSTGSYPTFFTAIHAFFSPGPCCIVLTHLQWNASLHFD